MGDSSISVDNESSGESKYAFSDELLVALERSGKSLAEIGAIILPLEGSDPPSISVNGQEYLNGAGRIRPDAKKTRIRELVDAAFAAKETISAECRRIEMDKKEALEKRRAMERLYNYLEATARSWGVTRSKGGHKRKFQAETKLSSGSTGWNHVSQKRRRTAQGPDETDVEDDEEDFSMPMKQEVIKKEHLNHGINARPIKQEVIVKMEPEDDQHLTTFQVTSATEEGSEESVNYAKTQSTLSWPVVQALSLHLPLETASSGTHVGLLPLAVSKTHSMALPSPNITRPIPRATPSASCSTLTKVHSRDSCKSRDGNSDMELASQLSVHDPDISEESEPEDEVIQAIQTTVQDQMSSSDAEGEECGTRVVAVADHMSEIPLACPMVVNVRTSSIDTIETSKSTQSSAAGSGTMDQSDSELTDFDLSPAIVGLEEKRASSFREKRGETLLTEEESTSDAASVASDPASDSGSEISEHIDDCEDLLD